MTSEVARLVGGTWAGTHWGIQPLSLFSTMKTRECSHPGSPGGGSRSQSQPCTPGRTSSGLPAGQVGAAGSTQPRGKHQGKSAFYLDPTTVGSHKEGSLQHPQLSGLQLSGLGLHF